MENKRIFIVDDDETALKSLTKLLLLSGYKVAAAAPSETMVESIRSFAPAVVLLDLIMPVSGIEICRSLARDAKTQKIPVIIVSAFCDAPDIKELLKGGDLPNVASRIEKPYEFKALLKQVEKVLQAHQGR